MAADALYPFLHRFCATLVASPVSVSDTDQTSRPKVCSSNVFVLLLAFLTLPSTHSFIVQSGEYIFDAYLMTTCISSTLLLLSRTLVSINVR